MTDAEREAAREAAMEEAIRNQRRTYRHEDFLFDRTQDKFWCRQTKQLLSKEAVDSSIPRAAWRVEVVEPPPREPGARGRAPGRREVLINPHKDIMAVENNRFVEGATWWPGEPELVKDRFFTDDGIARRPGTRLFNLFLPCEAAAAAQPAPTNPWTEHVKALFPEPEEHNYFFDFCAHMVQRPNEKGGAGVVLSGTQGIGKDAVLEPLKACVGGHNAKNIDPDEVFSQYKPWLRAVMLVIDEVRPSKEEGRASSFYNMLKPMMAAPPLALALNNKYEKVMQIPNVVRLFMTTNDYQTMFIPQDDRRLLLLHSSLPQGWHIRDRTADYFTRLFAWAGSEAGLAELRGWLLARDLSSFNPKLAPPKTAARLSVADNWVQDVPDCVDAALEALGHPPLFFTAELMAAAFDDKEELKSTLKSPQRVKRILGPLGYEVIRNPAGGKWQATVEGRKAQSNNMAFNRSQLPAGISNEGIIALAKERLRLWGAGKLKRHGQESVDDSGEEGF